MVKWNDYKEIKPDTSKLKSNENIIIECLVELEDGNYEVATFHPNIITVGGQFAFDVSPIKRWMNLEDLKDME